MRKGTDRRRRGRPTPARAKVHDRRHSEFVATRSSVAAGGYGVERDEQDRQQQIVDRHFPCPGCSPRALEVDRVHPKPEEAVARVGFSAAGRAMRPPRARGERAQVAESAQRGPQAPQEEPPIGVRIKLRRPRWRIAPGLIAITTEAVLEQHCDRVAAGDEVVIGEPEVEKRAAVNCEEAKRQESAVARKRGVELTLDLEARRLARVGAAGEHRQLDRGGAAANS